MDIKKTGVFNISDSLSGERPVVTKYDRRRALLKMGKYAAYTAPALLILLSAKNSDAACNLILDPFPRCVGSCPPGATPSNNCLNP